MANALGYDLADTGSIPGTCTVGSNVMHFFLIFSPLPHRFAAFAAPAPFGTLERNIEKRLFAQVCISF